MKPNKRVNKLSIRPAFSIYGESTGETKNHDSFKLPPLKIALRKVNPKNITRNHHQICGQCEFPKLCKTKFFDTCSNFFVRNTLFAEFNRMDNNQATTYSNEDSLIDAYYKRPETRSTSESPSKGAIDIQAGTKPKKYDTDCCIYKPDADWMLCQDDSIN